MKYNFDAVIIGGGASGLMCAISAKSNNPKMKVAIIEKNDRVGKKLLSTGNGRCNLTNRNVSADKYVGSFAEFSSAVFEKYNASSLLEYFDALGLAAFCDSEGRYYPASKQASSVLDVLRFGCERLGVEIFCGQNIRSLTKTNNEFLIKTENDVFAGKKLALCCGSKAAPKLGGSASAADYLRNMGHRVVPFEPALCPVEVDSGILKSLKGLRAAGSATLLRNGKVIKKENGEIQFTDSSLSGICVFNLSVYAQKGDVISLDIINYISNKELFDRLKRNRELFGKLGADNIFTGILQKRLAQAVLKKSGITDFGVLTEALSDNQLKAITENAKNLEFTVRGKGGFDKAQSALGGVSGGELDAETMKSRIVDNLFVCGEAVDICGECGGYNLHFAFASGIIAGESL